MNSTNSQPVYKRKNNQKQVKTPALSCTFLWKLPASTVSEAFTVTLRKCRNLCSCGPSNCRTSQKNEDAVDAGTVSTHSETALWLLLLHHRCDGCAGDAGGVTHLQLLVKSSKNCRKIEKYPMVQNHWHVTEKEGYCTALKVGGFVSMELSLSIPGCMIHAQYHPLLLIAPIL